MSVELDRLLDGIRAGNYHTGGIRCLRLFALQPASAMALRAEVDRLCKIERGSDVHEPTHVTNWVRPAGEVQQFSLLNRTGDFADFRTDHDLSCLGKSFHHASRYPRLAAFVAHFVHAINFRVNVLGPGASLAAHEEHSLFMSQVGTPAVRARFHLPIRTTRTAIMTLDGESYHFPAGSIYYFNQGCVHDASNYGGAPRVHLVWDMLLTQQTFDLMFGEASAPAGLQRIRRLEWQVRSLGAKPVGRFAAIAPLVTPPEAEHLTLCPMQ